MKEGAKTVLVKESSFGLKAGIFNLLFSFLKNMFSTRKIIFI